MDARGLARLNELRRQRRAVLRITDLTTGMDRIVAEDATVDDPLSEHVARVLRLGKSVVVEAAGNRYFINAYLPPPRLVVVGAVHISQAMAPIATIVGFDLEIIDPRTAFATPERFPGATVYTDWPDQVLAKQPLDPYCAVAAITHDPKIDDPALLAAIGANCFYIGALGSRKTHARRHERLVGAGLSDRQVERIAAPIGLDIGASSPQEIAVAVIAQIIAAYRNRGLVALNAAEEERILDA
jgi:xanthine dehydrogenase accessory factor